MKKGLKKGLLSKWGVSFALSLLFGIALAHQSPDKYFLGSYSTQYLFVIITTLILLTAFISFSVYSLASVEKKALLPFLIIASLLMIEAGARLGHIYIFKTKVPEIVDVYRYHPYRGWEIIPGSVDKDGRRHNLFGFRGPNFPKQKPENEYRIFAIGGSTTYSECAGEGRSYPELLQKHINEQTRGTTKNVRVINAGVRSYNSIQSLINYLSNIIPFNPDMIIVQTGINDAAVRLIDSYKEDYSHYLKPLSIPGKKFWENSLLATLLFKTYASPRNLWFPNRNYYLEQAVLNETGMRWSLEKGWLEEQTPGNIEKNPPDTFRRNLRIFKAVSDEFGVEPVFVTTPFENKGQARDRATVQHNDIIRKSGKKENYNVLDLAGEIPWNKDLFCDFMHMNEAGQEIKARIVAEYLLANGFF